MRKKYIKTLSAAIITAAVFMFSTGFTALAAPITDSLTPNICVSIACAHPGNTICGTHRHQIYGAWSDDYKVDSYAFNFTWYTVRERSRTVTEVCTDCQKMINVRTEYQQRSYVFGVIPVEDWYFV